MDTMDTNTLVVLVGIILGVVDLLIHVFVVGFRLHERVKTLIDKSTQQTAAAFKSELAATKAELAELNKTLATTKAELAEQNKKLDGTKAELAETRKDLDGTKEELQQSIKGLVTSTSERLTQTDARLGEVIALLVPVLRALEKLGPAGEAARQAATDLDQMSADQQGGSGENSR